MENDNKILAIDAGNTSIKAGYFEQGRLKKIERFDLNNLQIFKNWLNSLTFDQVVLSSVLNEQNTKRITQLLKHYIQIQNGSKLPFELNYKTPEKLGIDRICNAAYMNNHMETEFGVCIDIGTCIKFDVVHQKNGYLGGSIAPGINLRYKSLNDYTGNLPLLSNKSIPNIVGTSTELSISSGVMNGIKHEITSMMAEYRLNFSDLTFFVTGGDASFFDFEAKNDIFADENLTIKGLYEIYKHNA